MKFIKIIILLTIILLFSTISPAFQIEVQNDSEQDYYYNLWWINYEVDVMESAMIAGGELVSGERDKFAFNYSAGLYYVIWFNKFGNKSISTTIQVKKSVDKIILTPKTDGIAELKDI